MQDNIFDRAYRYVLANNTGESNPYHNNKHLLFVFEQSVFVLFSKYRKQYNLKSTDKIELGLAAIFHDFNHSGGKLKDSENIEIAISGLNNFLDENPDIEVNRENIINIIKATEYPHKDIELSILQKIIRDADMFGCISDNWFDIVNRMASEFGKTFIDFIPIQIGFLDTVTYNTPYFNMLLNERKEKIKKDLLKIQSDLMIQ